MGVLTELKPQNVFRFFEEICSIPHGSGNVKQISDYLVSFAKVRGLKYRQDEKYNVIIWKEGSKGYENAAPVILQGHMDMVAVKEAGCSKDMEKEGLDLEINGDYISARGTSLGGDDGIAVAYTLAILDDDSLAHPPLEAVITVDEEIGMLGADFMDMSDLKGRMFLNMDSEDEGVFTVSCAGGASAVCCFPYQTESIQTAMLRIVIDGFCGGHSGVEINKGRANANVVMGRILYSIRKHARLISVNGGEKDNAIALSCEALVAIPAHKQKEIKEMIGVIFEIVSAEYKITEPNATIHVDYFGNEERKVMTVRDGDSVIQALLHMPNGIQRMNPSMKGMVQTSLNLGVLRTEENRVCMSYALRSSSESEKQFLIDKVRALAELLGGTSEVSGNYPGWEYKEQSRLRDVLVDVFKKLYKKAPVVEGIHAGLECGIFASRLEGLDAVSIGPEMKDIHTVHEVLSISSVQRTWELVIKTLEALR
ncbi:MAG: aminoacyl-histidine dipeptidase [Eubacteriales bacterium]|nr:aminoacyl-histidine dipeptidase [Eubacteriales bacterium]